MILLRRGVIMKIKYVVTMLFIICIDSVSARCIKYDADGCPKKMHYPKPKRRHRGVDMGSLTNLMFSKHSGMNPYVNALPTSGDTSYLYLD